MQQQQSSSIVWVEKAVTTLGPIYRKAGPLAFGAALVSPTKTSTGADIYKAMRMAKAGDRVLHLADNEEFRGISIVAQSYETTVVDGRELYYVKLRDFRELTPPLKRSELFREPYARELRGLLDRGLKNTFFTRDLKLAQGAYLTPVPEPLMEVLNAAYHSVANTTLTAVAAQRSQ